MNIITIGIIASSLAAIVLVLLQDRSSGTGGAFGGSSGDGGGFYQTRRGVEKFLFTATIFTIAAFASFSIANLLLAKNSAEATVPAVNIETNTPGATFTPDSTSPTAPVSPAN